MVNDAKKKDVGVRRLTPTYVLAWLSVFFILFFGGTYWLYIASKKQQGPLIDGNVVVRLGTEPGSCGLATGIDEVFLVPERFQPQIYPSGYSIGFTFPDKSPFSRSNVPGVNDVSLWVNCFVDKKKMKSVSYLPEKYSKDAQTIQSSGIWFLEHTKGMDIYLEPQAGNRNVLNRAYAVVGSDGERIFVSDSGSWSRRYDIFRPFNEHIELHYLVSKEALKTDDIASSVLPIDRAAMELVNSFYRTNHY